MPIPPDGGTGATAPKTGGRTRVAAGLIPLAAAQLMITLDSTIVSVALPSLQPEVGLSNSDRAWAVTAYTLAFGGLLLFAGRLGGRAVVARRGVRHLARFTVPIIADLARAALRLPRRYVPLVGRPGELAFVNQPGAREGWQSVTPPGYRFDNRITASSGLGMLFYNAAAQAPRVQCPLLVCACDRENLIDPAIAAKVAATAPRAVLKHYDADHFTVYHPPIVEQIVADRLPQHAPQAGSLTREPA